MKHTEAAFRWIVSVLRNLQIRFHITGGMAARIYGAKRELADIDLDIPENEFNKLIPQVKDHIIYGPQVYKDDSWELLLMTLQYQGQNIDIAGAYDTKLFDRTTRQWVSGATDFSNDEVIEVYGINVPVMSKIELIAYKSKLRRKVDIEDVKALQS